MFQEDSEPAEGEGGAAAAGAADVPLVEAARRGDRDAFGQLYQRHAAMVHGLLLAQVPRAEAEDLAQEVFMQAMRKLPGLREPASFAPWLAAIARHQAADRHRRRRPPPPTTSEPAVEPGIVEAEAILALIHELPLAYRETLVLRLVAGMTGPEIAARTGLTPESVRVNLHRGMKKLRERLGSRAEESVDE
jgi:RNA polymerase sigma-70 factor (ECF subfamily)